MKNAKKLNLQCTYMVDIVRTAELLEVAPADLIIDGSKKEKGLTERQTC